MTRFAETGLAGRFLMATHEGIRCDANERTCARLAEAEFTVLPMHAGVTDPVTWAPITTPGERTYRACPRHYKEFEDHPQTWRVIDVRQFVRDDKGRLKNPGFLRGSECVKDGTCMNCTRAAEKLAAARAAHQ